MGIKTLGHKFTAIGLPETHLKENPLNITIYLVTILNIWTELGVK